MGSFHDLQSETIQQTRMWFTGKVLLTFLFLLWVGLAGCGAGSKGERVLCDFEADSDLDQLHWKCRTLFSLSDEHVTHGRYSLKMELFPSDYPGFSPELSQKDWRGYGALCFDVYNPVDQALEIAVRIDDRKEFPEYGERYNQAFTLEPGMNHLVIPLDALLTSQSNRKLSLGSIERFMVFMVQPEATTVLYLDYVRLIKKW
jgi:hypothetical protein